MRRTRRKRRRGGRAASPVEQFKRAPERWRQETNDFHAEVNRTEQHRALRHYLGRSTPAPGRTNEHSSDGFISPSMDLATRVFPVQAYDRPRSRISATKIRVSRGFSNGLSHLLPKSRSLSYRAPAANQQDRADVRAITSAASSSSPEPLPSKASLRVVTPPSPPHHRLRLARRTRYTAPPSIPPPETAPPATPPAVLPAEQLDVPAEVYGRPAAELLGVAQVALAMGLTLFRVLLPAGGVARQGCVELGVLGHTRGDDVAGTLVGEMELGGVREEVSGSVRFAGAMVPLTAVLASVLVMFAPSSRYNGGKPTSSHARLRSAELTFPGTPTSKEPAGPFSRNRHRRTVSSTDSKHVVHEMSCVISFPFHYNPSGLLAYFAG